MTNFFSRLSYSIGNEDWRTEHKALKIQPDDQVFSITASGDRPLNLLDAELESLITIDANPMQNALFELKKAAIEHLDYEDYLEFMGLRPAKNRLKTYYELQKTLSAPSSIIWEKHKRKIERGVIYQGSVETWLKRLAYLLRPFRGQKIDKLFSFNDLESQREFVKSAWQTPLWKKTFEVALHPTFTKVFFNDPGLYEHVDQKMHIGLHIHDRLNDFLEHSLAKESTLLSMILRGKVDEDHFPPYLNADNYSSIKAQLDKSSFETTGIVPFLEKSSENTFDCFSCSDVASYLEREDYERVIRGIFKAAKPGARFCIRQFLSNYAIPDELTPHFVRDTELEKQLEKEDCCFVYRFMCGTIEKD